MTSCRIIMLEQSAACVGGKWGGEQSVALGSFCVFAEAWRRSRRRQRQASKREDGIPEDRLLSEEQMQERREEAERENRE